MQPVTEHTPLKGDTIAVTNVNIFGSVDHVVLKRHTKTKKTLCVGDLPEDGLHRLVTFQARHEQGANQTMREVRIYTDGSYLNTIVECWPKVMKSLSKEYDIQHDNI